MADMSEPVLRPRHIWMMEAIITFKPPDYWIRDIIDHFDVNIKVRKSKVVKDGNVRDLVEVVVHEGEDVEDIMERIRDNPNISKVDVTSLERGRFLAAFTTDNCTVCRTLAGADCFLSSSRTTDEGKMEWSLLVTERKSLQQLIKDLEEDGVEPRLQKLTELSSKEALTARQEEITRMAFNMGYFDFPRRIGLKELAMRFDISTSTLSEILRKGQRHIMMTYFREKGQ